MPPPFSQPSTPRSRGRTPEVLPCASADRRPHGAPPWACDDRAFHERDALNILRDALVENRPNGGAPGSHRATPDAAGRAGENLPPGRPPADHITSPRSGESRSSDGGPRGNAPGGNIPSGRGLPRSGPQERGPPVAARPPQMPSQGPDRVTPVIAGPPKPSEIRRASTPSGNGRAQSPGLSSPRAQPRSVTPSAVHRREVRSPSPYVPLEPKKPFSDTLRPQPLYVGDKVRVKGSHRTGEIMYIGSASFAPSGKDVVGLRLDQKRTTTDCDGKFERERYFRCKPGYGIYLPISDVERVPEEDDDEGGVAGEQTEEWEGPFDLAVALDQMVGQKDAKANLLALRNLVEVQKKRAAVGVHEEKPLHFAILGTPGSGVSFTAKLLGRLLRELGVLERGHVVEAARKDLVDEAEKRVEAMVKKAQGGILLLSQAHTLKDPERTDSSGQEVIAELGKRMDALRRKVPVWPQNVCIVFSGPRAEVNNFFNAQSFKVAGTVDLVDFSSADLTEILMRIVAKRKFTLSQSLCQPGVLEDIVRKKMAQYQLRGNVRNLHIVQAVIEDAVARQSTRVWEEGTVSFDGLTMLIEEDFSEPGAMAHEQETEVAKAFARLDAIVGLDSVKAFIRSLYAQLMLDAERRAAGIDSQSASTIHMIFQGSPGTGKTTVARVVAELLKGIGWLRSGHLVEVDRGQLVAGYAGQTAIKTKAAVDSALGGVLFVDEAYALVQGEKDSFGREALDTLIKLVEDYRTELVVILAGYTENMGELMKQNPGLRSRFPTAITFPDYSSEEMMAIAEKMLLNDVLMMDPDATFALQSILETVAHNGSHSNGRTVRNIVEQAKRNQATRLSKQAKKSKEELCTLLADDFANVHTADLE